MWTWFRALVSILYCKVNWYRGLDPSLNFEQNIYLSVSLFLSLSIFLSRYIFFSQSKSGKLEHEIKFHFSSFFSAFLSEINRCSELTFRDIQKGVGPEFSF